MISFVDGNILDAKTEVIVNPVNCVGVMGAGLALEFKKKFPENFKAYEKVCKEGRMHVGLMHVHKNNHYLVRPWFIINFPTKMHWREQSKIEYIKEGLVSLKSIIYEHQFFSISIPALGCGLGGLKWEDVKESMDSSLSELKGMKIDIYVPKGVR